MPSGTTELAGFAILRDLPSESTKVVSAGARLAAVRPSDADALTGNENIAMPPATVMAPETKSLRVIWFLTEFIPLAGAINAPF